MSWNDNEVVIRKYIVAGSMVADYTGAWVKTFGKRVAVVTAWWPGTSTPDGEFYIQGTGEDPTMTTTPKVFNYYVDEGIFTTATLSTGVISVDSATAGQFSVTFEPIHPWIRVFWDVTDGGAAGALNVQITLKD